MRATEHDLNSLRGIIRRLQDENASLKKLLDENDIIYDTSESDTMDVPDEYDADQGARILPLNPDLKMAKKFYSYFWGRIDVFARRGKAGGYFPQCSGRWDNPLCPKANNPKVFCDEDCKYKAWKPLNPYLVLQHLRGNKQDSSDVIGVYPLFPDNTYPVPNLKTAEMKISSFE